MLYTIGYKCIPISDPSDPFVFNKPNNICFQRTTAPAAFSWATSFRLSSTNPPSLQNSSTIPSISSVYLLGGTEGRGREGEGGGGRGEGRAERRGKVSTLACTRVRMVYLLHIMPHTATRTALRRLSNTPHTTHHYTTTTSKYGGMSSTLPSLFHVTHPDSTTIPSSRTTRFISLAAGARRCLYSPRRWDNATSSQTKEKVPSA